MNFILHMDKLKKSHIEELKKGHLNDNIVIKDRGFHFYQEIISLDFSLINRIMCLKTQFSNILIQTPDGIKIYLDDYDIISVLIQLVCEHEEIGKTVLKSLYERLNEQGVPFSFILGEQQFKCLGLPTVESDLQIHTKADIEIPLNDFIVVLNLILIKEEVSKKENILKNVICKYICLTEHYAMNDIDASKILKECEYDVEKDLIENKNIIAKAGAKKFVVDVTKFLQYKKI